MIKEDIIGDIIIGKTERITIFHLAVLSCKSSSNSTPGYFCTLSKSISI